MRSLRVRLNWLPVALMLLCRCSPPVEFNILNNTGTKLVLHTPGGAIVLEPGAIVELSEHKLLLSKREGKYTYPTLHLDHLNRMWEYYVPVRVNEEWRRGWTFLIQVDSDLAIRIAKPKD